MSPIRQTSVSDQSRAYEDARKGRPVELATALVAGQRQHAESVWYLRMDDVDDARGQLEQQRLAHDYDRYHRQQRLELRRRYLRALRERRA
jgi:hypothetical protein